jgi:hypothetical protein
MIERCMRHGGILAVLLAVLPAALLAVLLWATPGAAEAGPAPPDTTRILLGVGVVFDAHTDLLASPFRQSGTGLSLDVGFERGAFSAHLLGATVGTSSALEREDVGVEDGWVAGLDVAWLHPVAGGERTTWRVGGGLSGLAFVRRHHYGAGASREYFADLLVPLSAVGSVRRALGGTVLEERVGVGIAAVLLRSPYAATKTFPAASFAAPGSLWLLRHRLRATWRMSPRTRFVLTHEATFYDTDRHRLVRVLQQRLAAGIGVHLGGGP